MTAGNLPPLSGSRSSDSSFSPNLFLMSILFTIEIVPGCTLRALCLTRADHLNSQQDAKVTPS